MTYDTALEVFAVLLALIGIALIALVAHHAQAPRLDAAAANLAIDISHAPRAPRRTGVNLSACAFTVLVALALLAVTRLLIANL